MQPRDEDDFLTESAQEERILEGNQRDAVLRSIISRKQNEDVSGWILQDLMRKKEPPPSAAKEGRGEVGGNQKIAKTTIR